MNPNHIGTCSLCGGRVCIPAYSTNPTPRCERCGAEAKPLLPVIEMVPPKREGRTA